MSSLDEPSNLAPETLDLCAKIAPNTALIFAAEFLTPETLDWCARKEPYLALKHAMHLLSKEQINSLIENHPEVYKEYLDELLGYIKTYSGRTE